MSKDQNPPPPLPRGQQQQKANGTAQQKSAATTTNRPTPVGPQRRHSARQLYRRYVNKSNIFARPGPGQQSRWPPVQQQNGGFYGSAPFRLTDSHPTGTQLEWQKQRRAQVRQLAMHTPTGTLNGPKVVQRHAEMRSYLLHCQRVLNARPRVDTGRLLGVGGGRSVAGSSSLTSPSVDSWGTEAGEFISSRNRRARSVPANGYRRQQQQQQLEMSSENLESLHEENRRLLERLVQISTRSPSASRLHNFESPPPPPLLQSRQSTGVSNGQHQQQPRAASRGRRRSRESR